MKASKIIAALVAGILFMNNGVAVDTVNAVPTETEIESAEILHNVGRQFVALPQFSYNPPLEDTPQSTPVPPVQNVPEVSEGRYRLSESAGGLTLWTDYPTEKVFMNSEVPSETGSGIHVYMAKNEFEPFQLVLKPNQQTSVQAYCHNMPAGLEAELHQVMYVKLDKTTDQMGQTGAYPDPLYPKGWGESLQLQSGVNTSLWVTLHSEKTISSGVHTIFVTVGGIEVPVYVHVFDFAVPDELHVKSQINVSTNRILQAYGVSGTGEAYWRYVENFKQFMIDHRLTPKSALWSGGLTGSGGSPYIDYNSSSGNFSDPHGVWGFEWPADRYIDGGANTLNPYLPAGAFNGGTGFPSFMAMTFKNNDASQDQRPDSFDGISRSASDWVTGNNVNSAYNTKWFGYIRDIESYLRTKGYIDEAYYYFANEPQDQADYDAVSWYANALKAAAPDLKLMVSEEPKPEIYDNSNYPGTNIDIWLPVLNNYDPVVSWERESNHGEETWIYFLHGTKPPYFNPITLDHPGLESKLTGWFLWKYRIKGIAHYSFNNWSRNVWTSPMQSGHNGDDFMLYPPNMNGGAIEYGATHHRFVSSIRFELMRDSLEDYEYLYCMNEKQQPEVYRTNSADSEADKVIYGLTSYNRDSASVYNLRKFIGQYIEGSISEIPMVQPETAHERAETARQSYYINFQDPAAYPTASPLIVNDKTYMKIGWNTYDERLGYGWYGDMAHVMYRSDASAGNPLTGSILYDDWGRLKTFEFDLPNGTYEVTVGCGWPGRTYNRNRIAVEGVSFIDDEATSPFLVRTKTVEIKDSKLTMEMGIFDEYTMLNYMEIVPID